MPSPSGYRYYRPLSDANGTALANFVCRVDLSASNFDFSKVKADGSDIRVYDVTGDATLPYWLQDFDPAAKAGRLFFKAANTGNAHRLYLGNAAASSAASFAAVFTSGTGFDSDWGALSARASGNGKTSQLPAFNGDYTSARYRQLYRRSNVATITSTLVANRPVVREFSVLTDRFNKVVQDGGVYVAYHIAQNTGDGVHFGQTWRCSSTDLVTWTNHQLVLDAGSSGTYDDLGARVATVQKWGNGDYRIWYTCNSSNASYGGVGYATSPDGINWTRQGNILKASNCGITAYSPVSLSGVPDVLTLADGVTMVLLCEVRGGATGYPWHVFGWTSTDGINWTVMNGGSYLINGASNGLTTGGIANPHLKEIIPGSLYGIYAQAFSEVGTDLTTCNGQPGWWTAPSVTGPYTFDANGPVAGRIYQSPSNFGTETGGLALLSDGSELLHIQDYAAPDNLNTASNIYRLYPVLGRCGVFNTPSPTDAALASMSVAGGTFTAENRCGMTAHRSGDNTFYILGLADSAGLLAPDTSTNIVPLFRLGIRRNTFSSGQSTGSTCGSPGSLSLLYWDAGGTIHYWTGSAWTTTYTDSITSECSREIIARIDDDGTNFILSAIYANDLSAITTATIAKSSVKALTSGRVLFAGVPFTNTNYGGAYSRQISVRPYAAVEPSLAVGASVSTSVNTRVSTAPSRLLESGTYRLLESGSYRLLESASPSVTTTIPPSRQVYADLVRLGVSGYVGGVMVDPQFTAARKTQVYQILHPYQADQVPMRLQSLVDNYTAEGLPSPAVLADLGDLGFAYAAISHSLAEIGTLIDGGGGYAKPILAPSGQVYADLVAGGFTGYVEGVMSANRQPRSQSLLVRRLLCQQTAGLVVARMRNVIDSYTAYGSAKASVLADVLDLNYAVETINFAIAEINALIAAN